MKKPNWILLIGLGVAAWYFLRKKPAAAALKSMIPGTAARQAASDAQTLVADVVDQTTFLPDLTTDRELYIKDLKTCK